MATVDDLLATRDEFHGLHVALDTWAASLGFVRPRTRASAGACAADIEGFVAVFCREYGRAEDAYGHQVEAVAAIRTDEGQLVTDVLAEAGAEARQALSLSVQKELAAAFSIGRDAAKELPSSFKAMYFFIRAYQDAVYRVLLEANKQQSGPGTSVNPAIGKENGLLATLLGRNYVAYRDWFVRFRDQRNIIKAGTSFSITGRPELGVIFNGVGPDGGLLIDVGGSRSVFLSDIISAVHFSGVLANCRQAEWVK